MKINLHIERLVLDGLPVESQHGPLIRSAITEELGERLASGELQSDLTTGGALSHLPAVSIQYSAETTPAQLGRNIAEAVHSSIRNDAAEDGNASGSKTGSVAAIGMLAKLCLLIAALVATTVVHGQGNNNNHNAKLSAASSRPVPGQEKTQPGPGVVTERREPVHLSLGVDRTSVQIAEEVTFRLEPAGLVTDPAFTFVCDLGDGTTARFPTGIATLTHVYKKARTRPYDVSVRASFAGKTIDPLPIVDNALTVSVGRFKLRVEPTQIEINKPVTFTVDPVSTDPNVRYRFNFGDGSAQTEWQTEATTSYSYKEKKTYQPYLMIGRSTDRGVQSVDRMPGESIKVVAAAVNPVPTNTVTPTPTPIPWNVIVVAGGGLLGLLIAVSVPVVGYKVWKRFKNGRPPLPSARPTFHPHPDPGFPEIGGMSGPLIEVRASIRSGSSDALARLVAEGPLLLSVRRGNA